MEDCDRERLGERLRQAREGRGLTQEALAEELHVSRQTVSNWERGKTLPDIQSLVGAASTLGMGLPELLGEDERRRMAELAEASRSELKTVYGALCLGWVAVFAIEIARILGLGQVHWAVYAALLLPTLWLSWRAFSLEREAGPYIAVVPVNHTNERHSPSAWKFSNALPTWSWNGLNGEPAKVEVYARAAAVELYVNGKKVGRKKFRKNCRFDFKTKYYDGEVTAVAYNGEGKEIGRHTLRTAGDETVLTVLPEKERAKPGEVCFVRLRFTDKAGAVKPLAHRPVSVSVEGGELLALGCACPFNLRGYTGTETDTYYGEAMAVVRAGEKGFTLKATDGKLSGEARVAAE